jgi:IS5 family transposase
MVKMEQKRLVKTDSQSFYGEYLYDQIIPADHFLRMLRKVIDWNWFTEKLIKLYKGEGVVGRPPFDPALVLKVEFIAYLYALSERQVEVYVNENLPAKFFVGLAIDQPAPDHSTLTVFRNRLEERGKMQVFQEILEEIVQTALANGIRFGSIQLIDSVHSVANVNTAKDEKRQKKGKEPRDPNARWGVKHQRKVKTEDGKEKKQTEYFFGYKAHVSMNAETGLITGLEASSGEKYDGDYFCRLVNHDLRQKLPMNTYAADRGYDDGDNHYHLELCGLHSAIHLKKNRTEKKDANKEIWLDLRQTRQYQQGLKERYKIERKFGEAKQNHGLGRCRYTGRSKFFIQAFFTVMVLNLKRMVKLITGIGFKTVAKATA